MQTGRHALGEACRKVILSIYTLTCTVFGEFKYQIFLKQLFLATGLISDSNAIFGLKNKMKIVAVTNSTLLLNIFNKKSLLK